MMMSLFCFLDLAHTNDGKTKGRELVAPFWRHREAPVERDAPSRAGWRALGLGPHQLKIRGFTEDRSRATLNMYWSVLGYFSLYLFVLLFTERAIYTAPLLPWQAHFCGGAGAACWSGKVQDGESAAVAGRERISAGFRAGEQENAIFRGKPRVLAQNRGSVGTQERRFWGRNRRL